MILSKDLVILPHFGDTGLFQGTWLVFFMLVTLVIWYFLLHCCMYSVSKVCFTSSGSRNVSVTLLSSYFSVVMFFFLLFFCSLCFLLAFQFRSFFLFSWNVCFFVSVSCVDSSWFQWQEEYRFRCVYVDNNVFLW